MSRCVARKRDGKWIGEKKELRAVADCVNAEKNHAAADDAKHVVAEGAVVGEGIEDEVASRKMKRAYSGCRLERGAVL